MITKLLRAFLLVLLIPVFGLANNNPVLPTDDIIEFTVNSNGEIIDLPEPTFWTTPGSINQFYLDNTHTQKTFNDIRLKPGTYKWTLKTVKRNNKPGKVNLDITVKFQNGSNQKKVDKKLSPGKTNSGKFSVADYRSQSGGAAAGYSKVKVHIGRAAHNTNVNYKITLKRQGGSVPSGSGGSSSGSPCTYTTLGSKSGNVVGNTVGKYTATKKACKNNARVKVEKTGGKARTTILIYSSNTRNGNFSLHGSATVEFPNGKAKSTKNIPVNGVNGKFIRVEVKNRSAANTFKYKLSITQ